LAGPGWTHQRNELSVPHGEVHAVQHHDVLTVTLVDLAQVPNFETGQLTLLGLTTQQGRASRFISAQRPCLLRSTPLTDSGRSFRFHRARSSSRPARAAPARWKLPAASRGRRSPETLWIHRYE